MRGILRREFVSADHSGRYHAASAHNAADAYAQQDSSPQWSNAVMEAGTREAVRLHVWNRWFGQGKGVGSGGGGNLEEGREAEEAVDRGGEGEGVRPSRNQGQLAMEEQGAPADFHIELPHEAAESRRDPESADKQMRVSESLLSLENYTPAASPSPRMHSPVPRSSSLDASSHDNHAGITEINVYAPQVPQGSETAPVSGSHDRGGAGEDDEKKHDLDGHA